MRRTDGWGIGILLTGLIAVAWGSVHANELSKRIGILLTTLGVIVVISRKAP